MLVCKLTEMPAFMARIKAEHPERMIKLKRRIETWRASNMDSRDIWNDACGFTSVIASLPPKESLDWLVFAYFDSFELEYPILDEQRFINAYEAAWDGPRFSPNPHLLMTLLLIIATTVNIYTSQLVEPSPILESVKTSVRRYIHLSERWLLSRGTQLPDLDSQLPHYKKACAEVAIDILSEHRDLLEKGNLSVCLKVDDVFQAALAVCNEINQPIQPGVPALSQLTGYVALIKPLLKSALKTGLDTVSDSFQDIIEFLGLANPLDPIDANLNFGPF
ncbi:hypothetical protein UCDDS831_g02921 [Diplodia seriata]|uniref:Uncharacterized protein n=1 Tax=Diplodia seriata TaxID=420778 RepID=A0A0G2EMZ3_9PEZI|nr:hypothetical protein UCDDS831_g02921 [Diplodia seriata]